VATSTDDPSPPGHHLLRKDRHLDAGTHAPTDSRRSAPGRRHRGRPHRLLHQYPDALGRTDRRLGVPDGPDVTAQITRAEAEALELRVGDIVHVRALAAGAAPVASAPV
jgi:hypothetical protein